MMMIISILWAFLARMEEAEVRSLTCSCSRNGEPRQTRVLV